jgi:hypothetical protein
MMSGIDWGWRGVFLGSALSIVTMAPNLQSAPLDFRADIHGGLASPAPGFGLGLSGVVMLSSQNGLGLSTHVAAHDLASSDTTLTTRSHDLFFERSISFWGGFHFIRGRVGAGASWVKESMDASVAAQRGARDDKERWAPHVESSVVMDFPVADLVWVRTGFWGEKALLKGLPTQWGGVVGIVVGGPWFGFGD